jgi:23S rRNA pseudouridine2605 synthase
MRDRPSPNHKLEWPGGVVPEWARPQSKRQGRGGGKGGGPRGAKGGGGKRERLQKVMAQSGYGSRRNIEILIAQGHLTINGQVAKLGDSVGPSDKVKLDGNVIQLRFGAERPRVLMYHKPEGEIVTRDDPEKRPTVFDKLPKVTGGRWVSVGRLDLNTGGLLLFTTNGDLANKLTHPRFEVEREYAVRVMGEITDETREKLLTTGVDIDGELCTFDSIDDRGGEGSNHCYTWSCAKGRTARCAA